LLDFYCINNYALIITATNLFENRLSIKPSKPRILLHPHNLINFRMSKPRISLSSFVFIFFVLIVFTFVKNASGQSFVDIAPIQGIQHTVNSDIAIGGSGVSFFDFDNDGWDDITFIQINDSIDFYKNVNGTFQLLPSFIFAPGENKQVLWVDYDNDGDYDIFLVPYAEHCRLYRNDGNFNFTDVTFEAGIFGLNSANYGVTFADYDKDGFLDFYLARYYNSPQDPLNPLFTNALYRNNGDGTFSNVTVSAGVGNGIQPSFMGVWIDINHNGWPDLYVINDRVLWGNSLYLNNGDGTFTDITESSGAGMFGEDPMGATFADFDNDGDLDILCTNGGPPTKPIRVYVNQGDNTFIEKGQELGIDVDITFHCTWGASWVDVNNDTFQDVYVTTGLLTTDASNEKRSYLFMSDSADVFVDSQPMFLSNHVAASYSVAKGDINNDGFADLVVQNAKNFNSFIWLNQVDPEETNSFVKVTLEGTVSNRMAIGSWVLVYVNGNQYVHYSRCGENFVSQDSQHHIFGLGSATIIDSIVVEYPSGHVDKYYNLAVNQKYLLKEGDTYLSQIATNATTICQGESTVLDAGVHTVVSWNTGSNNSEIIVTEPGLYWFVAQNEFGVVTYSDSVFIEVLPLPIISVNTLDPLCEGDETGVIFISNDLGVEASTISWNNGLEGDSLNHLSAGNYFFEYTDVNGCVQTGIAQLQEPDYLFAQVFPSPDFGNNDGSLLIIINGGTPPYFVYLDGEEYSTSIFDLQFGTYQILVEDFHFCTFETEATIDHITADRSILENTHLLIYPNPTTGILFVDSENFNIKTIRVFDLSGRVVLELESSTQINSIDLRDLTQGCYTVELFDGHTKVHRKVMLR